MPEASAAVTPVNKFGEVMVLKKYFGLKEGQSLQDFSQELKELSGAEKLELAQLACKALGLTAEQVKFSM